MFLLDTNICIFYLKGLYGLRPTLDKKGFENCAVSEMTVAELKYGIAKSERPEALRILVEKLLERLTVISIFEALDIYAVEKARLKRTGKIIDDFDILIGATAIHHNMVMVTNNTAHLSRLENIVIEDWTVS